MADRAGKTITLTPKALDSRNRRAAAKALEKDREEHPYRFSAADYDAYIKGIEERAFARGQERLRATHAVRTFAEREADLDAAVERGKGEIRTAYPFYVTHAELAEHDREVRETVEKSLREQFARELAEKEAAAQAAGVKHGADQVKDLIAAALARVETLRPRDVPGLALLAGKIREAILPADPSAEVGFELVGDILTHLWRVKTD